MIQKAVRLINIGAARAVKPTYFKMFPHKVTCNICGWLDDKLMNDPWHPHVICPGCGSKIRQRLFWAALHHTEAFGAARVIDNKKVLHFAPDRCLAQRIAQRAQEYKTADFLAEGYSYKHIDLNIDISDMKDIEDEAFDCVMAFDVLEHVPNYQKAVEETNRVLSPGGYCVFTVPQKDDLEKTYEDPSITDPQERQRIFGQWDHLRIFGNDFKEVIADRGFEVTLVGKQTFDEELVRENVLYPPVLSDHPLATNDRQVYFGRKVSSLTNNSQPA